MIYLDNASTTQIDSEVLDAMYPYLKENYGNPGGLYNIGKEAKKALENSRDIVAMFMGSNPQQIIFTSGGSESNSTVFNSTTKHLNNINKKQVLISSVEHDSVIHAATNVMENFGFDMGFIPVDKYGVVTKENVRDMITQDTGLVSVMYINNETGIRNNVNDIGKLLNENGILFHTDCVQAAGSRRIDVKEIGCDFASISSHKIHGPKGVGCLFVKDKKILTPTVFGGKYQEFGLRGGTENIPGIVGFAKACEIYMRDFKEIETYISCIKQLFYNKLVYELEQYNLKDIIRVNGKLIKPGKILNITINGVDSESLVMMLDSCGVCASAGSACRSHESTPSHVLIAMGISNIDARSSIRFSFSKYNTEDEINEAVSIISKCIRFLIDIKRTQGKHNE